MSNSHQPAAVIALLVLGYLVSAALASISHQVAYRPFGSLLPVRSLLEDSGIISVNTCNDHPGDTPYRLAYDFSASGEDGLTVFGFTITGKGECASNNFCCSADLKAILIGVNAELTVLMVKLNGEVLPLSQAVQFGKESLTPRLAVTFSTPLTAGTIPSEGLSLEIVVDGAEVQHLCDTPALRGSPGQCEVKMVGGSTAAPTACCAKGLSLSDGGAGYPTALTLPTLDSTCSSFLDHSIFRLVYKGKQAPSENGSYAYVSYEWQLTATTDCLPGTCCSDSISVDGLYLYVADDRVSEVKIGGQRWETVAVVPGGADVAFASKLVIAGLDFKRSALLGAGISLVVTARKGVFEPLKDLCSYSPGDDLAGACLYQFLTSSSSCCPQGVSTAVAPSIFSDACYISEDQTCFDSSLPSVTGPAVFTLDTFAYDGTHTEVDFTWTAPANGSCGVELHVDPSVLAGATATWTTPGSTTPKPVEILVDRIGRSVKILSSQIGNEVRTFKILVPGRIGLLSDLCTAGAAAGQKREQCAFSFFTSSSVVTALVDPPTPFGSCAATYQVPTEASSMSLNYFDYEVNVTHTVFTFLITVEGIEDCMAKKGNDPAACDTLCGWTLFINPDVLPSASMLSAIAPVTNDIIINTGDQASITWNRGQTDNTAELYTVTMAGNVTLAQLCGQPAAEGGPCKGVLRGLNSVTNTSFHASSLIKQGKDDMAVCAVYHMLPDTCYAVNLTLYQSDSSNTTATFAVSQTTSCSLPALTIEDLQFHVYLTEATVNALSSRPNMVPSRKVFLDKFSGITWIDAQGVSFFTFNVLGAASATTLCDQEVTDDQAAGTCVVEMRGNDGNCILGPVRGIVSVAGSPPVPKVEAPGSNVDIPNQGSGVRDVSKGGIDEGGVIAMSVVLAVAAALAVGAVLTWKLAAARRREAQLANSGASGSDDGMSFPPGPPPAMRTV